MQNYIFRWEANVLLIDQSSEKVSVFYNDNAHPFHLPKVGPRPPYYCNPRYEPYYPVI